MFINSKIVSNCMIKDIQILFLFIFKIKFLKCEIPKLFANGQDPCNKIILFIAFDIVNSIWSNVVSFHTHFSLITIFTNFTGQFCNNYVLRQARAGLCPLITRLCSLNKYVHLLPTLCLFFQRYVKLRIVSLLRISLHFIVSISSYVFFIRKINT